MSDDGKRFESFSDITGEQMDILPSAYSLKSVHNNAYYELSNEELESLSLKLDDIEYVELIHVAPHKRLIRLRSLGKYYILLDASDPTKEYRSYELLQRHGVRTLPIYAMAKTDLWCAILMEDLHLSDIWKLASPRDVSDYNSGVALGKWYKDFHEKGVGLINDEDAAFLEREYDELTAKTIHWAAEQLGLSNCGGIQLAAEYIEAIKRKARTYPETVLYNDFSHENMALTHDGAEAAMFDYHLIGRGYRYSDIRNILSGLKGAAIDGFIEGYGKYDESEKMMDDVLAPLYSLLVAAQRKTLPKWAKPIIKEVKKGLLEEKLRLLLKTF